MGTIARRLLQLVVVVILSTLFAFSLLRLFPGDVADAVIPFGTEQQREQFREDNGLDKPFFEQYFDLARQPRAGRPRQGLPVEHAGERQAGGGAAGVAPADALRADHRPRGRDPARRVHRLPRQHQDRPRAQRRRVRAARAPELRARARPRVLRRRGVATRPPDPRADPGDRLRAGLARGGVRSGHRRHRPPRRHPAAARDLARRGPDRGLHAPVAQRHDRHAAGELHHHGARQGSLGPAHPLATRAAAVEPHAAHRRRPQLRHAHRRRGRGRGDLRGPRAWAR